MEGKSAPLPPPRSGPIALDRLLRAQCAIYRCRNAPRRRSWQLAARKIGEWRNKVMW
jgi:hypothetical protein